MYKLHSKRCTNSEHPKRDLAIFKCQQVLSAFDVANKTSQKKKKSKFVEFFQEKGIREMFLVFLICAKFCPKKNW